MSGPSLQNRRTPRWFFGALEHYFGPFSCDLFASPGNALLARYFTKRDDALARSWPDRSFGNPPFELMAEVVEHAHLQAVTAGRRSIIVSPVGCSQSWYQHIASQWTIYVPDCRVNFDTPSGKPTGINGNGADRDTIVLAFGPGHENPHPLASGVFNVKRLGLRAWAPKRLRSSA